MSRPGYIEPQSGPTRELRRLAQSTVVPTVYSNRDHEIDEAQERHGAAARQGYRDGYAEGLAKALTEAELKNEEDARRTHQVVAALASIVSSLRDDRRRAHLEIPRAAASLAFALLEEMLAREVAISANPGLDAITRALALDDGMASALVRMNPGDVQTLGSLSDMALAREIRVVADPSVQSGGAVVEIGAASLDAQLSTALERVRQVLVGVATEGGEGDVA